MGADSQLIVASLYSPDGNVDTLSVSVMNNFAHLSKLNVVL